MPVAPFMDSRAIVTMASNGDGVGFDAVVGGAVRLEEFLLDGNEGGHDLRGLVEWAVDLDAPGTVVEFPMTQGAFAKDPFVVGSPRLA